MWILNIRNELSWLCNKFMFYRHVKKLSVELWLIIIIIMTWVMITKSKWFHKIRNLRLLEVKGFISLLNRVCQACRRMCIELAWVICWICVVCVVGVTVNHPPPLMWMNHIFQIQWPHQRPTQHTQHFQRWDTNVVHGPRTRNPAVTLLVIAQYS